MSWSPVHLKWGGRMRYYFTADSVEERMADITIYGVDFDSGLAQATDGLKVWLINFRSDDSPLAKALRGKYRGRLSLCGPAGRLSLPRDTQGLSVV